MVEKKVGSVNWRFQFAFMSSLIDHRVCADTFKFWFCGKYSDSFYHHVSVYFYIDIKINI